jgi:hypothetical protein
LFSVGISVLNAGIFWREAKTKKLFSQCIYPLSWCIYTTTLLVMVDRVKGRAPHTLTKLCGFLNHDGMYARKWLLPLYSVSSLMIIKRHRKEGGPGDKLVNKFVRLRFSFSSQESNLLALLLSELTQFTRIPNVPIELFFEMWVCDVYIRKVR